MKNVSIALCVAFCFGFLLMPTTSATGSWPTWIGALDEKQQRMTSTSAKRIYHHAEIATVEDPAEIPARYRPVHYRDLQSFKQGTTEKLWWPSWIGRPNQY